MNLPYCAAPSHPCFGLPAAAWSPRSALHSRSSSVSTAVDDLPMALPSAGSDLAAICPAYLPQALSIGIPTPSLHALLKPLPTAPCSPRSHLTKNISAMPLPFARSRRDSMISADAGSDTDDDDLATDQLRPAEDDDNDDIFAMDADTPGPDLGASAFDPALDPATLAYGHKGRPQPWAVRQLDQYDSVQAQIQAIDDDDNEFYP